MDPEIQGDKPFGKFVEIVFFGQVLPSGVMTTTIPLCNHLGVQIGIVVVIVVYKDPVFVDICQTLRSPDAWQ